MGADKSLSGIIILLMDQHILSCIMKIVILMKSQQLLAFVIISAGQCDKSRSRYYPAEYSAADNGHNGE